jgi:hypoxanthine phosphoribosyltransferase
MNRDYQGRKPLLIGVLKGSFMFLADLVRRLEFPLEVDFIALSSYGGGTETSGKVRLAGKLKCPVKGRDVVVVEDIVDTGITLRFFIDYLLRKKPSSLKVCALLDKSGRRRVDVPIDYTGFVIPDEFVVGYGLDYNESFRHLPGVYVLRQGDAE